MSKFCPIYNEKVVYLTCQECDNKLCREPVQKETGVPAFLADFKRMSESHDIFIKSVGETFLKKASDYGLIKE